MRDTLDAFVRVGAELVTAAIFRDRVLDALELGLDAALLTLLGHQPPVAAEDEALRRAASW